MQISNLPKLLPVPFASSGSKQDIPVASQIGVEGGRASYTDGFPPLTRTPIAAGGIPPFGTDFNGVLNDVTAAIRWAQSGGGYRYDSTFSAAIGGYPIGAVINNSTGDGCWLNTIDGNNNNPEVATATPLTGWVPVNCYGSTNLSGLGASSLTLNTLQASKDIITLSGTLTANISIILPAWIKKWNIANNCTGSFSVTVKTPSGTGVVIPTGSSAFVHGDGTNIVPTLDPTLAAIANLSASANKLPYFSGVDIAALTDLTSVGRDIIGKNNIADILTYLGLGEGSALPVGVPVPWPSATPPTGWLKCNGAPFSAEEYPELAKVYPTNELPDLRGEFIRGWDDGRGVDAGRELLSAQSDLFKAHHHNFSFFKGGAMLGGTGAVYDFNGNVGRDTGDTGGNETRPRNIAFNYIVRAA